MLYQTRVAKEAVEVPQTMFGKNLSIVVEAFRNQKKSKLKTLFFLVKQVETHATFYSVSFNVDASNGDTIYYDIFLGCYVLDYTQVSNRLIEMENDHEANYPADELYKQLESKPCFFLDDLIEHGYIFFCSDGFPASETTRFKEYVELLSNDSEAEIK